MTREEAVNRLCDIYSGEFDVRLCEEHRKPLAAQMDFYAESSKYVLSKKAKLWEANSFEYVYLFNVPHLTKEIYDQCEKLAYDEGMARIKPGPNHMYTYITALFVCAEAVQAVQELQNVLLGLDGFPYRAGGAAGGIGQHQPQRTQCSAGL